MQAVVNKLATGSVDQNFNSRMTYFYTPFTRSSKHRTISEQTSSKCIQNTCARRVLSMFARCLLDVCLMTALSCKRGIRYVGQSN